MRNWIKIRLKELGKNQAKLAEHLELPFARVSEMVKGIRNLKTAELPAFSEFMEMSPNDVIQGFSSEIDGTDFLDTLDKRQMVLLKGRVGAGQAVYPIDDGGQEHVEAPEGAASNTVAIEVEGDSMLPHYPSGSILYYSQLLPPMDRINKRSVVQLADGRLLLKQVVKGAKDGFFTLISTNAEPIEDVVIEWVAKIDWIKPRD